MSGLILLFVLCVYAALVYWFATRFKRAWVRWMVVSVAVLGPFKEPLAQPNADQIQVTLAYLPICHGIAESAFEQFESRRTDAEGTLTSDWKLLATSGYPVRPEGLAWFQSVDLNSDGESEGVVRVKHPGSQGETLLLTRDDLPPRPMGDPGGERDDKAALLEGGQFVEALASRPGTMVIGPHEVSTAARISCRPEWPRNGIVMDTGSEFDVAKLDNQTLVLAYGNAHDIEGTRQLIVLRAKPDLTLEMICAFRAPPSR